MELISTNKVLIDKVDTNTKIIMEGFKDLKETYKK
jgi:hypothetical protein